MVKNSIQIKKNGRRKSDTSMEGKEEEKLRDHVPSKKAIYYRGLTTVTS